MDMPIPSVPQTAAKVRLAELFDSRAPEWATWIRKNQYFHDSDAAYLRFLIPEGASVLELGCGTGHLLKALRPARGVGIDLSPRMIDVARQLHPDLQFHSGDIDDADALTSLTGPFDYIVLSDTLGYLEDCEELLSRLHPLCSRDTRIIIGTYSHLWEPIFKLASRLGLKLDHVDATWLSFGDISNMLDLAGFQVVRRESRQLLPRSLLGLGSFINRWIAPLPLIRSLCVRRYLVARPAARPLEPPPSVSIVIPCRNESGNIEPAIRRLPPFAPNIEVIFVEGHSKDGTWDEVLRVKAAYPRMRIKALQQPGIGKGDAVRAGFDAAENDILMILDADLTVAPEDLPKFYRAITSGKAEFVNGSRLVYPMEDGAMRFLNFLANQAFASLFTYLLNQRLTDTLCGTKVLSREHYRRLVANRHYFGEFDPFGDFDLIFGANKMNLSIVEVPVRYASRTYGETQISRFRHGWELLKMVVFAFRKLKAL